MDILSTKQRFGIIGNNPQLNNAIDIALRVAATDFSVVVSGESGVGKEFFPQIIHSNSSRKHNNYIAVNCGAIPEGTIDSELFGHEKGAFTGASDTRKGYFEMADGGTIFLDEIGELPQSSQARLLRVLQSGEFIRVGSSKVLKTNVRVIAATNINLPEAVQKGLFREDLYYRLNTVPLFVPALRDRKEDIHLLFRKFSIDVANRYSMPPIRLQDEAKSLLEEYRWPGNIRQLKNVAEQISIIEQTRDIDTATLSKYLPDMLQHHTPAIIGQSNSSSSTEFNSEREILYKFLFDMKNDIRELKEMIIAMGGNPNRTVPQSTEPIFAQNYTDSKPLGLPMSTAVEEESKFYEAEEVDDSGLSQKERHQKELILKALTKHNGKRKEAAAELFISERTLYRRIKELGIDE